MFDPLATTFETEFDHLRLPINMGTACIAVRFLPVGNKP